MAPGSKESGASTKHAESEYLLPEDSRVRVRPKGGMRHANFIAEMKRESGPALSGRARCPCCFEPVLLLPLKSADLREK